MKRALKLLTVSYIFAAALVFAPGALAFTHNGQGIYGPTDDVTIMDAMFLVMGIVISIIVVFSLIQAWLEHRHYAKLDASKHSSSGH